MQSDALVYMAKANTRMLETNLDGVTHEEALVQPPGGNCINWLLGHILSYRNGALAMLGLEPVSDAGDLARYERGSEPIRGDGEGVLPLDRLRAAVDSARDRLAGALEGATPEKLAEPTERGPLGDRLAFLLMHETYHIGQIALLRRIAGREGAIR